MKTVEEIREWIRASEKSYESVVGPIIAVSGASVSKARAAMWRAKRKCYGEHLMDADTMDSAFLALASTGNYNPLTFIRSYLS